MPDFDAIATATAARFAPGQVTPPVGLTNVRRATANLPQRIGAVPIVLVYPDRGTFPTGGGHGTRLGESEFIVRFYFGVTRNLAVETNACRKWLTVLVDQLRTGMQFGGLVVRAAVVGWRIGSMLYAGKTYTGIELNVHIETSEPWSPTS